jgi:dynein heavy chain, axonemal
MAAVCVMKSMTPDRTTDPATGKKAVDYWGPSKRLLGDMGFLQSLKDFDKDNINPDIMKKIRKDFIPHKDFQPNIVAKVCLFKFHKKHFFYEFQFLSGFKCS